MFRTNASTVLGTENSDQHVIVGDTYIGYSDETSSNLPENNDVPGGTLFLHRGLIVGHENTGNASIKMNGNIVFELGDPVNDTCAVSKGWVKRYLEGEEPEESTLDSLTVNGSTTLGDSNDDQHAIIGDTYIGYDRGAGLPNNNDAVGGTLFTYRGISVGQSNTGNASIKMNGNIVFELGNPVNDTCAVSKGYVENDLGLKDLRDFKVDQLQSNDNVLTYLVGLELKLANSNSFAEWKASMLTFLKETIETMDSGKEI